MILYGATYNKRKPVAHGTAFTIYGGTLYRAAPEEAAGGTFELFGATNKVLLSPTHFELTGALYSTLIAPEYLEFQGAVQKVLYTPAHFELYGPTLGVSYKGINISGLSISNIAKYMSFNTPATIYNIYPYVVSDIKEIQGTSLPWRIVGNDLLFDSMPEGPIVLIPFNRLRLYTKEVRKLTITNTIPNKLEFSNIVVSGDFEFSLSETGPWSSSLAVTDYFYIKALDATLDGIYRDREFLLTATAVPRG